LISALKIENMRVLMLYEFGSKMPYFMPLLVRGWGKIGVNGNFLQLYPSRNATIVTKK